MCAFLSFVGKTLCGVLRLPIVKRRQERAAFNEGDKVELVAVCEQEWETVIFHDLQFHGQLCGDV